MTTLSAWKTVCAVLLFCAATAIAAPAQTFQTLVDFNGKNGANPFLTSLVQGYDGSLYGTTVYGGDLTSCAPYGCGTVFRITHESRLTELHDFEMTDGAEPEAGLTVSSDGSLYGTTQDGGDGYGTIFKLTQAGILTTLHVFEARDGGDPYAGLAQGIDGSFYGTTYVGGAQGRGTVFRITAQGRLSTLYSFCAAPNCTDGAYPQAGLIQATDGNFYGTTVNGGANCIQKSGCGTIFRITPHGSFRTVHSFDGTDGSSPTGAMVQASDGDLYGTTYNGGAGGAGTVFRIGPTGLLSTLYSFYGNIGAGPLAGVIEATDGNFYGTTAGGGASNNCQGGCGTVFQITPAGSVTILHNFDGTDGASPGGRLVQATTGPLYGATGDDGNPSCPSEGCGTIFSLDMGLGPFITFVRAAGKAGQTGRILGQGFTGASGVSFNGDPATFKVVSDTFIRATVPAGATTGYVTVATPSGTLTSNVPFHVIP